MTTLRQSESIGKLGAALAKAQSTMEEAKENTSNPFFKSTYADLTSVWRACKSSLATNDLAIVQAVDSEGEKTVLVTTLIHGGSGEWMKSFLPLYVPKNDSQSMGSALSYARRYALAAIVGVYVEGEDDDAEKATERKVFITDAQVKEAIKMIGTDTEAKDTILKRFSAKALNEIPQDKFATVMSWLETRAKEKASGKARVA